MLLLLLRQDVHPVLKTLSEKNHSSVLKIYSFNLDECSL
jgi:uncharacterized membrane protein (DUF4010 family)